MPEASASTRSIARAICSGFVTSTGAKLTPSRSQGAMSQVQTFAPALARLVAIARPMPLEPPVTTAVRPEKSYVTGMGAPLPNGTGA